MRKLAIFDIDGTLFRSSLFIELFERLVDNGVFPQSARRSYQKEKTKWLDRQGTYESYIEAVIASFMANIRGVHYRDFYRCAVEVVDSNRHRVYRYTRDLIKDLKKKNYFLLAVSQSPKAILDIFCKGAGFDKVYGRLYELGASDKFTGRIADMHLITNKANIVKRTVEKNLLAMKGSIGVGDTESDIPFLELVEKPICFNPNAALLKHARRNKWKVVVERKDVIYAF